ncbi:MAG: hypothetical protein RIT14_2209 [Pseudomonadota bacterium]|jgi:uncharacterized membrane protein
MSRFRRPRAPLFLKRQSYRRRRLRDAARMLPVLGAFLFLLPILWSPGTTEKNDTAPDGVYLFLVWIGLVLLAAALAPGLSAGAEDDDQGEER